jgi:hypothetical protein
MEREQMSNLDRLILLVLFGAVGCGALYGVGKLAHYLLFGDGWRAFCSWMAGRPNTTDAVVAAVVVAVLVYARLRR